jgi:hypothetical protein
MTPSKPECTKTPPQTSGCFYFLILKSPTTKVFIRTFNPNPGGWGGYMTSETLNRYNSTTPSEPKFLKIMYSSKTSQECNLLNTFK